MGIERRPFAKPQPERQEEAPRTPFDDLKRDFAQFPSKKLQLGQLLNVANMDFQSESLKFINKEQAAVIRAYLQEENLEQKSIKMREANAALKAAEDEYYRVPLAA